MRQPLKFFILIILFSCGQRREQVKTKQENVSVDSIQKTDSFKTNKKVQNGITELSVLEWEKHEDSLRNVILNCKENKILKNSFLQEMYIRNVLTVSANSLFFKIPFNLHGADCGAPDCYVTDITFSFRFSDTLIFPQTLQFQEHEHGCIEKEKHLMGNFHLIEQTDRHVIYHSTKQKRTLVLFNSNKDNGTTAFYFTEVGRKRINVKNVYNIMKDFNVENINLIHPFTSWILTTKDYENFLN